MTMMDKKQLKNAIKAGGNMDYDQTKIKKVKRIINGKEVEVSVAPAGMHGKGYKPGMFDDLPGELTQDEKDEIRRLQDDLGAEEHEEEEEDEERGVDLLERSFED